MILYFIRHGDPTYNPDQLTPLGRRQAEALAHRLCRSGIDRIFSSPMKRAQQTALPTSEIAKIPIEIESWTSEALAWKDFAIPDGNGDKKWCFAGPKTELRTPEILALTKDNWYTAPFLKETHAKQGFERIVKASDEFFKKLGYERDGAIYHIRQPNEQRIALFAHGGFGLTWLAHLFNLTPTQVWNTFDFTHTGVTTFLFKNYDNGITFPYCLTHSDISHLYAENLPLKYCNRERI